MGWSGTHPKISRDEALALLPPGACRTCVYRTRVFVGQTFGATWDARNCSRCGSDGARSRGALHFNDPARRGAPPKTPAHFASEFYSHAKRWLDDCEFLSSTTKRTQHPAFQRIVEMGEAAIPLLQARLHEPGDWDLALARIKENLRNETIAT